MARGGIEKLHVKDLRTKKPGLLSDGGNLNLRTSIGPDGKVSRGWIFRFQLPGKKPRDMGLGSLDSIGLAKARDLAGQYRELVATGIDPIDRRNELQAQSAAALPVPTFDEVARSYIAAHDSDWRNPKHAAQWRTSLAVYASPVIGKLPVDLVNTDHVMKVVEPIWKEKTETAKRIRARIESVLNYATARKYRSDDIPNPARWKGHIAELLARPSKIAPVEHHEALPYAEIGAFMEQLRGRKHSIAALALEFCILTCARTDEVLKAVWNEIDFDTTTWTVPAGRIKAGREHKVPLSKRALEILQEARAISNAIDGKVAASKYIFANPVSGKHLSSSALLALMQIRMKRPELTVHGFRSCFRDWAAEVSHFPAEAAELALAHKVADKAEAAYRRGSMFNKRRLMMEAWASYCAKPVDPGKVLTFAKT
jgi:integrase